MSRIEAYVIFFNKQREKKNADFHCVSNLLAEIFSKWAW